MPSARARQLQAPDNTSRVDEDSEHSESQSSQDNIAARLHEDMRKKIKQRRDQRRLDIRGDYVATMSGIEKTINATFNDISHRMLQRRKHQLQRVMEMIKRRHACEARMLASYQRIEEAFVLACNALEYALGSRLHDSCKH